MEEILTEDERVELFEILENYKGENMTHLDNMIHLGMINTYDWRFNYAAQMTKQKIQVPELLNDKENCIETPIFTLIVESVTMFKYIKMISTNINTGIKNVNKILEYENEYKINDLLLSGDYLNQNIGVIIQSIPNLVAHDANRLRTSIRKIMKEYAYLMLHNWEEDGINSKYEIYKGRLINKTQSILNSINKER